MEIIGRENGERKTETGEWKPETEERKIDKITELVIIGLRVRL